jgi:hypothetical protein
VAGGVGLNDLTVPKWQAFLALERDFSAELGASI